MSARQRPQSARRSRPSSASAQRSSTSSSNQQQRNANRVPKLLSSTTAGDLHSSTTKTYTASRASSAGSGIRASRALRRSSSSARMRRSPSIDVTPENSSPLTENINASQPVPGPATSWTRYCIQQDVEGLLGTVTDDIVDHLTSLPHTLPVHTQSRWVLGHMERYARSARSLVPEEQRLNEALYHLCLICLKASSQAEEDAICAFDALVQPDDASADHTCDQSNAQATGSASATVSLLISLLVLCCCCCCCCYYCYYCCCCC
jgi:hypothetical protein